MNPSGALTTSVQMQQGSREMWEQEALAKLDFGDESSWELRSSAIIQSQTSVDYPLLISAKRRKTLLQSQAQAPSELILIILDKRGKKGKERMTTRNNHHHRHLVKRKQLRLNMTHLKANQSIKAMKSLKQCSPPLAQLLNCILLTSQLKDKKETEGGDVAWIYA